MSEWENIGELFAFVGRTGFRDDDLGSRIIAAKIVNYLINICFLLEKKFKPYPKWFGNAFKKLEIYN